MAHGSRQALTVAPKLAASEPALLAATLLWSVLGALLGGLLLNLMPCVFPVLAIKAHRKWRVRRRSHWRSLTNASIAEPGSR